MRARIVAIIFLLFVQSPAWAAEVAKITSMDYGFSDTPELYSIIYADKDGNLRIEGYGVTGMATSAGGKVETTFNPGDLQDLMIFQAEERRMLFFDRGQCRVMSADGAAGPGMPAMPQMPPDAMAQMQEALAEMEKENPALAEMMKQKMNSSNMLGSMMQEPRETVVERSGDDRTIGDYDTTGFVVYEKGNENETTEVWAADIDEVEGGRLVGHAMVGFFGAYKDMMENMGVGGLGATGMASAVIEKMKDYYPIETKHARGRTTMISAETGGEVEFYPDCQ
ncbi:MAG: hypothetical protein QNJ14_14225 [Woeseiaceae bacterium]|nr:hypothetical protein [Woeseiaceae bacterium]